MFWDLLSEKNNLQLQISDFEDEESIKVFEWETWVPEKRDPILIQQIFKEMTTIGGINTD